MDRLKGPIEIAAPSEGGPALRLIQYDAGSFGDLVEIVDPTGATKRSMNGFSSLAKALGIEAWNYPIVSAAFQNASPSQSITGQSIWLPAGLAVNRVLLNVSTAGVGTAPAGFFVGISDGTTMLAQSGNLASSASLTATGLNSFPLSAPWVVPVSGLYYIHTLQNGAFGTTNVLLARSNAFNVNPGPGVTGISAGGLFATGQTALPANGQPVGTIAAGANALFWVGVQ